MDANEACIAAIAKFAEAREIPHDPPQGSRLSFPDLRLEVTARKASFVKYPATSCLMLTIDAKLPSPSNATVSIFTMGTGDSLETAANSAALVWGEGVLIVLADFLSPAAHFCEIHKTRLIAADAKARCLRGWTVCLSPVIGRDFSAGGAGDETSDAMSQTDILLALQQPLASFMADDKLLWIEAYAAKYPEGDADATCRLRNRDWAPGQQVMLRLAATWPTPPQGMLSRRQFLLFVPTPVEQMENVDALKQRMQEDLDRMLSAPQPAPWWRRLLSRR